MFQIIKNVYVIGVVALMLGLGSSFSVAEEYQIDPSHSTVGFAVKHLMVSTTRGNFTDYTGSIQLDKNDLSAFNASVTIQVKSINTQTEARDNHLRGADFFDTEKFPTITFESKTLKQNGDAYEIVGDLTIKGVKKEISIPVTVAGPVQSPFAAQVIGIAGQITINRQDFGVSWNKSLDAGGVVVDDNVTLIIEIEASASTASKL